MILGEWGINGRGSCLMLKKFSVPRKLKLVQRHKKEKGKKTKYQCKTNFFGSSPVLLLLSLGFWYCYFPILTRTTSASEMFSSVLQSVVTVKILLGYCSKGWALRQIHQANNFILSLETNQNEYERGG